MTATESPYRVEIRTAANGRCRKAEVVVLGAAGKPVHSDRADLHDAAERDRLIRRAAQALSLDPDVLRPLVEASWHDVLEQHRRLAEQAAAGSPEAAAIETVQLLDVTPPAIRRPLCLVNGQAYAAAWVQLRRSASRTVERGVTVDHDPPLVTTEDALLIVTGDGALYSDGGVPGARPLADLGIPVHLPSTLPPGRGWTGAGVKRYFAGERSDPAEVFARLVSVIDRFIDFDRSLAPQQTMCELTACYAMATWMLDAFGVAGYLWPNGEKGSGKTSFLQVVAELSYLGQVVLNGSSYACLRDLADYGATLAFDDAEAVTDLRRGDPAKRELLLAGNRRGATVTVKEPQGDRWVTRHVSTFCPRLFSAIRLPDEVLGSRSIVVPLVRSGDPRRSKANVHDAEEWPCARPRLLDDLWALGLAYLPQLPPHDREAAAVARLSGRNLEPWRTVLGVAHWLQHGYGVGDLFDRLEALSVKYQEERGETEAEDRTRVLLRALLRLSAGLKSDQTLSVSPKEGAEKMNGIAAEEDLAEGDRAFTTPRKVGWLLKRQRFNRGQRHESGKRWEMTRGEIEVAARNYGVEEGTQAKESPF
jgi:hypothetical protein